MYICIYKHPAHKPVIKQVAHHCLNSFPHLIMFLPPLENPVYSVECWPFLLEQCPSGVPQWQQLRGLDGVVGKESARQCRRCKRCGYSPWVREILWRRKWQPTPIFLPGESHGQRSLVGYSPWGCRVRHNWSNLACTHTQGSRNRMNLKWRLG